MTERVPASLLWVLAERDRQALTFADRYLCEAPPAGTFSNVLTGSQAPVTLDTIRQAMGRLERSPMPQPARAIVPPGWPYLKDVPAVPLDLLAAGYELRTDRHLHGPYRRERFSGGVNLTAQAHNKRIDLLVYVLEPQPGSGRGAIYVSPRMLKHLKGLAIT